MEPNYKPNSHKSKAEAQEREPRVKKVVTGKVKTRKKNEITRVKDAFISEDASNVKSYVLMDVIVPTIKNTIVDIVTDSIRMIFLGESGRKSRTSSGSKVSYRSFYDKRDEDRYSRPATTNRNRFDIDDILLESRGDAEMILDQMDAVIDEYGHVTVADLYDMVDMSAPYTAARYGWTSIGSAEPVRTRDGYLLKLPRPKPV
jgi:hypothetical protein